nr:calcium-binding protein P-like [Helicoverpa armigera]
MIRTVLLLSSICGLVTSSGVHGDGLAHLAPVAIGPAPAAGAPVVTAASSQYFQRTFNRLVVPQAVAPVAPPPLQPVFTVAPAPPVFVEPTREVPVAVNPPPTQPAPVHPNVAIAVATAHAAAPVATILLPPYPFGFPPNFGLIPQEQPINVPDENNKEPTTQSTTQAEVTTQEPEQTTPIPSSSDDNFVQQALPSNEDVNFNQYGPPLPPQDQQFPPNNPGPQFQPNQPRPQFPQQQPQPQFPQQQPRPQFQPQQPQLGQFPLQQSRPQFQPQQPQGQFPPQQPRPQYQPQQPEFPPQRPQGQFPPQQSQPQFPPQQPRPQYQPLPQAQQPRPQFQPQARPQQPRPTYGAPQQPWPQQRARPQKLKTSVEVVPVPLAYITPPPPQKTHAHVKVVKHIYTFVPATPAKIIVRPVVQTRPLRLVKIKKVHSQNLRANARDIEVTTFSPFPRPNIKPPKV